VTDNVFAELMSSVAVPNTADVHAVTLFDWDACMVAVAVCEEVDATVIAMSMTYATAVALVPLDAVIVATVVAPSFNRNVYPTLAPELLRIVPNTRTRNTSFPNPVTLALTSVVSVVELLVVVVLDTVAMRSLTVSVPLPSTASPAPAIMPPSVFVVAAGRV
jgi:hypothetical protein